MTMAESFDLIVIGSGPGGYVAAIRAAQLGLKVACVEKNKELGGTCLNVGCIPSKTLLHATEFLYRLLHEGKQQGIESEKSQINFPQMMAQKQKVIASFNEGIAALFKKNQIVRFTGTGTLSTPTSVQAGSQELSARHILLATGSEPIALPFLPFDEKRILSSTGALALEKPPKKLLVVGAGVIGVELGSVYSRLGTEVVFVEFLDRICSAFDESLSKTLQQLLTAQKMTFHLSSRVVSAEIASAGVSLQVALADQSTVKMSADAVLVSVGRKPYTQHLGLEKVGVLPDAKGFIPIDGRFRTSQPHIFAIGDLVDGPMLAHKASEEGVAVAEIIAGHHPFIEYLAIPNVIYTYPEVASVGLTEAEAKQAGLSVKVGQFPFKANSRARCVSEEEGFVKIIAEAVSDRILGVHIIGAHASELIAPAALAIQHKLTALALANTPYAHPTLAEAIKEAALAVHKRAIHR